MANLEGKYYCRDCKQVKPWFRFRIGQNSPNWSICFSCERYGKDGKLKTDLHSEDPTCIEMKLLNLINKAMKNKMVDLRNHLFETLENLKDDSIKPENARMICDIGQCIINSAKVELDFIKVTGVKHSQFMQIEDGGTD